MYEDTSVGEEYEDIDMDPAGVPLISGMPGHGVGVGGPASPSRRPPMPLPGPAPARRECTSLCMYTIYKCMYALLVVVP